MRQIPGIREEINTTQDRVAELLRSAANAGAQPNFQDIIQSSITASGYKYGAPAGEKRVNFMDALNASTDRRQEQAMGVAKAENDILNQLYKAKETGDKDASEVFDNIMKLTGNDPQEASRLAVAIHESPEEVNGGNFYSVALPIANKLGIRNLDVESKRDSAKLLNEYRQASIDRIRDVGDDSIIPAKEVRQQQERLSKQLESSGIPEIAAPLLSLSTILDEEKDGIPGVGVFDQMVPGKLLSSKGRKIRQHVDNLKNVILKARSGGAVTPQEAERFLAELGDSTEDGLRNAVVNITDTLSTKLQNFESGISEDAVNAFESRGGLTSRSLRKKREQKAALEGQETITPETLSMAKEAGGVPGIENIPTGGSINTPEATKTIRNKNYVKINGEWYEQ